MYNSPIYQNNIPYNTSQYGGDRFIGGGFLAPFLLGGITGGLLAPAFTNQNRPCCGPYPAPYYPQQYPYYGPYYR